MVFIASPNSKTLFLNVNPDTTTLYSLKQTLHQQFQIPISQQRLLIPSSNFNKDDGDSTLLSKLGITRYSTLTLNAPFLGGTSSSTSTSDIGPGLIDSEGKNKIANPDNNRDDDDDDVNDAIWERIETTLKWMKENRGEVEKKARARRMEREAKRKERVEENPMLADEEIKFMPCTFPVVAGFLRKLPRKKRSHDTLSEKVTVEERLSDSVKGLIL